VVGPVVRDGAVLFDDVRAVEDLPVDRHDEQAPGRYRLATDDRHHVFDVVNGPGSLKPLFYAPRETLVQITRDRSGFSATEVLPDSKPLAVLGARACDLAAVGIQDHVFIEGDLCDSHYARRREGAVFIAVNCTRAAATCFCKSMGTGPAARYGYDVVLTELDDLFVAEVGGNTGTELVEALGLEAATAEQVELARSLVRQCGESMQRQLDVSDMPAILFDEVESAHWEQVAKRCLSCTNCTMVCPTCFCHAVIENPSLDGTSSQRCRQWDSCFSYEFARITGKNLRPTVRDRYRHWLTHKLAAWITQFGSSGCVGCGRCIAWCPAGIDLTAEVVAIRATQLGASR